MAYAIVYAIGIAFCVALALYPKTAPAQEVVTDRGLICDTSEQVARMAVNAEKSQSCAVMPVAFIMLGEAAETVRIHGSTWQIREILIVGADAGNGFQPVQPMLQWSAFYVEEKAA
jgi:hypothetical protein